MNSDGVTMTDTGGADYKLLARYRNAQRPLRRRQLYDWLDLRGLKVSQDQPAFELRAEMDAYYSGQPHEERTVIVEELEAIHAT